MSMIALVESLCLSLRCRGHMLSTQSIRSTWIVGKRKMHIYISRQHVPNHKQFFKADSAVGWETKVVKYVTNNAFVRTSCKAV